MSQTRLSSLMEANANTFLGFGVSYAIAYTILPLYGMEQSAVDSLEITIIFTVASVARNYFVRRWFNARNSLHS